MWFRFITTIDNLLERIKYWIELSKWERQKRKEGFPKEWFTDTPTEEDVAKVDEIQADLKDELYKDER